MNDCPLVIVGISGFGRETADVVDAAGRSIAGFLDDCPSQANLDLVAARGGAFLGGVHDWLINTHRRHDYLIGIGSGTIREYMADMMDRAGHRATTAIHPSTTMGFNVEIGEGTVICAGTRLSNNVTLGRHVHLNPASVIGHDACLGDFVSVNPNATVSGAVTIGRRTLLGASTTILQNLRVGADVVVGAAALVTKGVPARVTVVGIPARSTRILAPHDPEDPCA